MTEGSTELAGGCACGAVRYRLTSAPMFVNCCHCLDCQRQTGGAGSGASRLHRRQKNLSHQINC